MNAASAQEIAENAAEEIADKLAFSAPMPMQFPTGECAKIILSAITAAVAQAKEEDTKIRETIAATGWCESEGSTLGQVTSICDGLATLREKVKALELKEPATDNVNAVLQKALEPFARLADKFDVEPYNKDYPDALRLMQHPIVNYHNFLTLGDCRRAKSALKFLMSEHSNAAGATIGKQESNGAMKTCSCGSVMFLKITEIRGTRTSLLVMKAKGYEVKPAGEKIRTEREPLTVQCYACAKKQRNPDAVAPQAEEKSN